MHTSHSHRATPQARNFALTFTVSREQGEETAAADVVHRLEEACFAGFFADVLCLGRDHVQKKETAMPRETNRYARRCTVPS